MSIIVTKHKKIRTVILKHITNMHIFYKNKQKSSTSIMLALHIAGNHLYIFFLYRFFIKDKKEPVQGSFTFEKSSNVLFTPEKDSFVLSDAF